MSSDEEAEFNDGVEEDEEGTSKPAMNGEDSGYEEMNGGGRKRRSSRGTVSYKEDDGGDDDDDEAEDEDASAGEEEEGDNDDDDDDDDDDDVPLASLKSPSPAKKKKASATKADTKNGSKTKTKTTTKASATKKKKTATATTKSASSSSTDYASPSFALYGSESKKGELIQKLLCRWWYAITWPDASALPDKPPPNYDTLDGFPGVYVCTKGEEVGTIKDMRDKNKAPNFNNFAKMSSKELRDLLIKAVQEQKRQLIAAEGAGTSTEKELNSILNWAEKVNTDKADKDAAKILKASKLSLPE